jgi:hypothetical protein
VREQAVPPSAAGPARWLSLSILLATVITFFLAARFLPAIDTHAASVAVAAGYTNQLLPLVAILLGGAAAMGAFVPRGDRPQATGGAVPFWRWHIIAAAWLCVAAVVLVPVWSQPQNYFGERVTLMDAGERPYVDFEYAYGALLAYLPYGLHAAGLSIQAALEITLGLAVIAGVWAFAVTTERWIPDPRYRLALFWALTACECFVDPGPSLNYNFGRYALPFALLTLVTRAMLRGGAWTAFAATAAANTLVYCLSPEMGCALTAAILAWLAIAVRLLGCGRIAAGLVGLAVSVGGLVAFASPMFTTLWAYGQSQVLMPVVPNPIMTLFVVSILCVGAWAFATTWALWRGQSPVDVAPDAAQFAACVALAFALLPAAVGRSWPTITIAYGFAPIVLLVGRLLAAGAARAAAVAATLFCFFVAYSAWPGIHADVGRLASELRGSASVGGRRNGEGVPPPMLLTRFRGAYDPLRLVAASAPPITNLGYYSGLRGGDVTTQAALARKMAELQRAPFYLAPTRPERIAEADGPPISRTLNRFARAGLYPFALSAQPGVRRFGADFVDLLLNRCQVLASADGMEVCTLRKDPSPLH